jgi:hypothetical protein
MSPRIAMVWFLEFYRFFDRLKRQRRMRLKKIFILLLLVLLSCSPSAKISDVLKRDGETYFTINGNKAVYTGTFNRSTNPLIWKVNEKDIMRIEQLIQEAVRRKAVNQYDYEKDRPIKTDLTDRETGLLRDMTTKSYYRIYAAGTNRDHDRIMEIACYPNQDSETIIADIIVNLSKESLEIR